MRSRGHACNHLPMNLGLDEITLCATMDPTFDSDSNASAQGDSITVTEWKELFEEISRLLCDCESSDIQPPIFMLLLCAGVLV